MLLLLLAVLDEVDHARAELSVALNACDRIAAEKAAAKLASFDSEKCADAFAQAFRSGLALLSDLDKERLKQAKEMETWEIVKDAKGQQVKGDFPKYMAAKKLHDPLVPKVEALNSVLPHLMTAHLTKLSSPAAAKGLAATLRAAPEWFTRAACADTLGRIDDPAALDALLARAKVEEVPNVKVALADALGFKAASSEEARRWLALWTGSPYWQIRLAAAHGLARSGDRASIPTLLNALVSSQGRMRSEINAALRKLSGVDKNGDYGAWKEWWETNREALLDGSYSARATERGGDQPGLSTFYGVPLVSTRLAFLLDVSISMKEPSSWKPDTAVEAEKLDGERALDVGKYEIRKIIRRLPEGAMYNVVAVWGYLTLLNERMIRASRGSEQASIKWINALDIKPGTNLFGALSKAFEWSGGSWNSVIREDSLDTIYVISDGQPSIGFIDRPVLAERVADTCRWKKIVVHCIAVAPPDHGRVLLKALAAGTGGTYVER
jgi:HEAT repeat protein